MSAGPSLPASSNVIFLPAPASATDFWHHPLSDPVSLFTAVVAFFTFGLIVTSWLQWRAIKGQLGLAREEFNASHRPKLILRDIEPANNTSSDIRFGIVNVGDAVATIVSCRLAFRDYAMGIIGPLDKLPERLDLQSRRIYPGERIDYLFETDISPGVIANASGQDHWGDRAAITEFDKVHLTFVGWITYLDQVGRIRRSAFARRYDAGNMRFVSADDPEREYAD